MSRAFIFTMDAVLALIPVFIILAGVSQLSSSESLLLGSQVLGSERIAQDVLQVMSTTGDVESLNQSRLNQTLRRLIPSYLNYSYEVEYSGSVLFTITNGTLAGRDIMVARRLALSEIDEILGDPLITIGHGGSAQTEPCCTRGPDIWFTAFYVEDTDAYDYWLVAETNSSTATSRFHVDADPFTGNVTPDCCDYSPLAPLGMEVIFPCTPCDVVGPPIWIQKIKLDDGTGQEVDEEKWNRLFVQPTGNPNVFEDYYVIKVPQGTPEEAVTSGGAKLKDFVWVTLKTCPN